MPGIIAVIREINLFYYIPLLVLPLLFLIFKHIKSSNNLPPGPFPWPIIGNIFAMGNKPHISLAALAKTHGPLMSLRLGTQLLVVGSSPVAATEILKTNDKVLSARRVLHALPASPDKLHYSVTWADCTDQWKYLRTLIRTELFSSKVIEAQAEIRDKKVGELVEFLHTKEGKMVNVGEVVFNTIFNLLSNLLVSKDLIDMDEEVEDEGMKGIVRKFVEVGSSPNLADYYTILSGLDLQGLNKKTKEIHVQISGIWEVIIKERREGKGSDVGRQRDLLDTMLQRDLTNDHISYLFLELFLAGTDPSTSTVEWAMAELLKNPEVMKKLRIELEREINGSIIKDSDLPRLPYLQAIVKEALRLHPPAPFLLPHRALETCKVMNYTVPKDSQVFVNLWAIGKDPNVWEDPTSFKPERFLDSSADPNSSNLTFIPFGAGRRICPGQPMVLKQVPLILGCLINCFDWSLPHDMHPTEIDMEERFGIVLQKEKPLVLIPKGKAL